MGCCGEDEEDLLKNLVSPISIPNPETLEISTAAGPSSYEVLSPMNSNFSALVSRDLLRAILEILPPADLGRAACVCRLWRAVASDRDMLEGAFRAPWKVKQVLGEPSSPAFWRHPALDRFAISHRLRRSDTVAGLALKYSVQVMDIKRLNNMMSDHGIYSRERLLVPISKPELLHNSTCYIELDVHAKREVAVLYLEGGPDQKAGYLGNRAITDGARRKILDSVKRSMQVDDGTAEYYLSVSDGDPRAAMLQFSEDLRWEQRMRCL
ncbi:F-box protein [Cocos nucifera]|uniref:F-box protein n=1 Tax=Cocos nucifera TaxID=13894 RepID=A0A8K0N1P5_COCNU|nr:F-box protein [Cocos nucifera]